MKLQTMFIALPAVLLGALAACSSSSNGTTATTSTSTGTTGAGGSSMDGGKGGMGGAGPDGGVMVNGCTEATAVDMTADAMVTIQFPVGGLKFSPACVRVKRGTAVTFAATTGASFAVHPLRGGTVVNGVATPATSSPITPQNTGTTATFTMATAGTFGFYCNIHYPLGMYGAVFVLP